MEVDWTTLKGKYFHTFDEKLRISHQGLVLGYLNPDTIIVEYLGWQINELNTVHAHFLKDVVQGHWAFYPTEKEMKEAFTRYIAHRQIETR
jgi:hypothetical protein